MLASRVRDPQELPSCVYVIRSEFAKREKHIFEVRVVHATYVVIYKDQ